MDTQIRALERQAAAGDIAAALRLARIRDSLRPNNLRVSICPIGYPGWSRKQLRFEYVSIHIPLVGEEKYPVVTTVGTSIQLRVSHNFFLRNLKRQRRK